MCDAKLLGEPELPPKVGACFFFIIMAGRLQELSATRSLN